MFGMPCDQYIFQQMITFSPSIIIGKAHNAFFVFLPERQKDATKQMADAMSKGMQAAMREQNKDHVLEEIKQLKAEAFKVMHENKRLILFDKWEAVLLFLASVEIPEEQLALSHFENNFAMASFNPED